MTLWIKSPCNIPSFCSLTSKRLTDADGWVSKEHWRQHYSPYKDRVATGLPSQIAPNNLKLPVRFMHWLKLATVYGMTGAPKLSRSHTSLSVKFLWSEFYFANVSTVGRFILNPENRSFPSLFYKNKKFQLFDVIAENKHCFPSLS